MNRFGRKKKVKNDRWIHRQIKKDAKKSKVSLIVKNVYDENWKKYERNGIDMNEMKERKNDI